MKNAFWNCVLGIVLLAAVSAISLHAGDLVQETGGNVFTWRREAATASRSFGQGQEGDLSDRPLIILDAGHGGFDPGKVGVDGQLEKDINLKIVQKLKRYLELNDVQVILTRDKDEGLYDASDSNKKSADMRRRVQIINEAKPDVMVSIHQNSYHQPEISGAQVFYYQHSEEGREFAQLMQKRFDYCLGEGNRRQAKANGSYYLLSHSKPVSLIVEAGFLSNPEEARRLETDEYQDKIAWTVAMGILQYINKKGMG
ncbi:MAG: N-acetylmuramoyl-L-alanine amidase [Lachnospiraceae bacterium]|nr:N-acetylmuramoyl-L-alanine amidase [Lachnospiraceae bacterium]